MTSEIDDVCESADYLFRCDIWDKISALRTCSIEHYMFLNVMPYKIVK